MGLLRNHGRTARLGVAFSALIALFAAGSVVKAQTSEAVDRSALRVCADPGNLPFSNRAEEGFENKIADLLAEDLGVPVRYTWFPQTTGFVRNTLGARKCDLVIGISLGFELLQNSNPYYRSSYALVYRSDSGLAIESLTDPALKDLRLGVVARTPPATIMARQGLLGNTRPYHLMADTRFNKPGKKMVEDVVAGEIDVGVLWGPIAGYYALKHDAPLTVVSMIGKPGETRLDFRITMGLRFNEPDWKHQINDLIAKKQVEINAILMDYGVPLIDDQDKQIMP